MGVMLGAAVFGYLSDRCSPVHYSMKEAIIYIESAERASFFQPAPNTDRPKKATQIKFFLIWEIQS